MKNLSVVTPTPTTGVEMKWLKEALAETYVLYVKTQNFHWNVTGPNFYALHLLSEKQYEALADSIDEIAERIRALGVKAPGTMELFKSLSRLEETSDEVTGYELLSILVGDHRKMAGLYRDILGDSKASLDPGTADLFTRRLLDHEKAAWMLESHIS